MLIYKFALYKVKMTIIKKLIIKTQLKYKLKKVEQDLSNSGYYIKQKELNHLIYSPDEYAILHEKINNEYNTLLKQKNVLTEQLRKLSSTNSDNQLNTHTK